ncbi:hypothetical protein JH314_08285 [Xanthomonas campestris]|jgi:hypothetical protein|uniref:hypothetical protein n=1 Tax=Xanthomonas campestris TaxID=339 RepID=UPI000E316E36|nr:hypothetical protein [Xanthomonas campestris]MCF8799244.1 hypothetical protein [Xanthomonas campestris pv. campestris]MCF8809661.1 hypothetical protein [Xanthomonas campestris pv. campestris]MCF8812186.1 hypothetical protein [Xanthomonas campestris pv. campestris]MDM7674525.1 hypothetical protein [Xanthomonas campestris pv. campestris]MEA9569634.1 hypothetical protein [Xanthomonas campestris]
MTFSRYTLAQARGGLALLVIATNLVILAAMLGVEIPPQNKDIVLLLVGGLVNLTGIVGGYYFGSNTSRKPQ